MKKSGIIAVLAAAAMILLTGCASGEVIEMDTGGRETLVRKDADDPSVDASGEDAAEADTEEVFEPAGQSAPAGRKVEFTAKDIDGNEITSEELFSRHEVTMVNVWATWCGWCIYELPELERINARLADKDCAIVGLLGDGTDNATIEAGRQLLKENGCTYLNLLPWDDALTDDFPITQGWPTSFFVDREGRIAFDPVIGAETDRYEACIDTILSMAQADPGKGSASDTADTEQYRVYVTDTDGNPVEGVSVQFCDDSTCRRVTTDAAGLAAFEGEEAELSVHVLEVPAGYRKDEDEYFLPASYSDLDIVLEKE